jgi:uncharacterized membrane protein YqjE
VPEVVNDIKLELQQFLCTRLAMFRSEMNEKMANIKMAAPVILVALLLVLTGWFLFTAFLVAAIAMAFSAIAWNYAIACLIVCVLYLLVGLVAGMFGWRQIRERGLKPERTLRVLKQDQVWLQTEAKTQV